MLPLAGVVLPGEVRLTRLFVTQVGGAAVRWQGLPGNSQVARGS